MRNRTFLLIILASLALTAGGFAYPWQPIESVTNNAEMDMMPSIALTNDGKVLITAHEIIPNRKYDIFLFEQNGANSWKKTNLTNTDLISDYYSVVKCDSKNNLHVFFISRLATRNNQLYLYYTARINGTWSPVTCLTATKPWNAPESEPAVAIDNKDNIHVVFHDDDGKLFYLEKTGIGWQPLVQIAPAKDKVNWSPTIAVDKNKVLHVVYLGGEDANYRLLYITKTQAGSYYFWSEPELLVPAAWQPWHPNLAIAPDGTLNIVFACDTQLQQNIGFIKGNAGKWSNPERILATNIWYDLPTIAVDKNGIAHVVYHGGIGGNEGPYEIYYTTNRGGKWAKPMPVTNNNIFQYNPTIILDQNGYGYLVFYGFDGYDTEIFYTKTAQPIDRDPPARPIFVEPTYTEYTAHTKRVLPPIDFNYIPSYATTLNGKKICISPGHGGLAYLAEYKIGATLYRESEMNYAVADYLREYLENVGVTVYMCRTTDIDIPLNARPQLANEMNADLFISIHHNSYDFYTNYVSFYYHADPDFEPTSIDICRYLHQELASLMNIPTNGVMSDYYSYWNTGYAELRGLKGRPGLLGEGSHYYCFTEEEMLRNLDYLKREAYAYFIALAKYFSANQPTAQVLEPAADTAVNNLRPRFKILLDEGIADNLHKIVPSSIQLKLDGKKVLFDFDWRTGILTYQPKEDLAVGEHTLELNFANFDKINAQKTVFSFKIGSTP
ncbi:MAG: N-acetylmuramoyl-L-alanine amidase [bacterium]|nr:N-acetylmuramoyl-L-alanine amidase [bacterium]